MADPVDLSAMASAAAEAIPVASPPAVVDATVPAAPTGDLAAAADAGAASVPAAAEAAAAAPAAGGGAGDAPLAADPPVLASVPAASGKGSVIAPVAPAEADALSRALVDVKTVFLYPLLTGIFTGVGFVAGKRLAEAWLYPDGVVAAPVVAYK